MVVALYLLESCHLATLAGFNLLFVGLQSRSHVASLNMTETVMDDFENATRSCLLRTLELANEFCGPDGMPLLGSPRRSQPHAFRIIILVPL